MKGWQIFTHSVRQVFGNFGAAIRVSGVLYLAQAIIGMLLGIPAMMDSRVNTAAIQSGEFSWFNLVIGLVVVAVASLWIAVGWHRYVLLVEEPGLVPTFRSDRILGYFGKSLLIGLILVPIVLIMSLIVGPLAYGTLGGGVPNLITLSLMGLLIYFPAALIGLRLSTCLPGVALQSGQSIGAGWQATKGEIGTFVVLTLAVLGVSLVINLPAMMVFDPFSVAAQIWQFLVGWVAMMVGVSILTTLYGHYIEKRPLV